MERQFQIGVAGFVLIVGSVALALTPGGGGRPRGLGLVGDDGSVRRPRTPHKRRTKGGRKATGHGTFIERLEQRWEKRRQDGQGW